MNENSKKKKILVFSEYYLPGYKSGGGMRTIVNIVRRLNYRYEFFIVTKDHDGKSDKTPYKNIKYGTWNIVDESKVFYLTNKEITFTKILELFNEIKPDILYSNSYFSIFDIHLLLLKRLGKIKNVPYLISPCGELSKDSFRIGTFKKNSFVTLAKLFKFHKGITWKASSEVEKNQIVEILGNDKNIEIAPDLISEFNFDADQIITKPLKTTGYVKMVFLSRFNKKKNFKFLLENLFKIKGNVELDIYGPIDDELYWSECQDLINKLPENIKIEYRGSVSHTEVVETLKAYHFFVLPTQHENFGHVFLEALSAGCPLVISDRTPWQNLEEKGIGWSLALEETPGWQKVLQKCIDMNNEHFNEMSINGIKFLGNWIKDNDLDKETINLFESLLSDTST